MSSAPVARILKADQVDPTLLHGFAHVPGDTSFEDELQAAYAAGFADGQVDGERQLATSAEQLSTVIERARGELTEATRAQRAADVDEILTAATDIASWLVRRQLHEIPDDAVDRVRAVLADVDLDEQLDIEVAPSLVGPLERWLEDRPVTIVANDRLEPGEAVVRSESGEIDATFDNALARVRAALTGEQIDRTDAAAPIPEGAPGPSATPPAEGSVEALAGWNP